MLIISSRTRRGLKFSALRAAAAIVEPMSRAGLAPEPMRAGILMYHRIAPEVAGKSPLTWNVTPDRFRRQLADLLRLGFRPWPLQDLLDALADRRPFPPRTFAVTFDDGYASIHDYAWPILRELQIPATVFLATQYLDQAWFPFDDWAHKTAPDVPQDRIRPMATQQIRAMLADPLIAFGSHTHSHQDFRRDPAAFAADLVESLLFLRGNFGIEAPSFAFPYGYHTGAMVEIVRRSGACCALTVEPRLTGSGADPFRLGRFNVDGFETHKTLSLKLDGWYGWLKHGRARAPAAS